MSALPVTLGGQVHPASGRIFLTGTQALVRLAMIQRERDLAGGPQHRGFISGYRGSPLGGFDQALWKAGSTSRTTTSTSRPA
jgi:indolepyruvate ferredoxin oxidoreductase